MGFVKWSCSVMYNSLRPHGLQLTRLLHPWDFPGKKTRVSCHFLLQGIFLTQGSNSGLLHCRQTLLSLSDQGIPQDGVSALTKEAPGSSLTHPCPCEVTREVCNQGKGPLLTLQAPDPPLPAPSTASRMFLLFTSCPVCGISGPIRLGQGATPEPSKA